MRNSIMKNIGKINRKGRLFLAFGIYLISIVWAVVYFRYKYVRGSLLSTADAPKYLGSLTFQTIFVNLPIIVILIVAICMKGKVAIEKFSFKIRTRSAKIIVIILSLIYVFQLVSWLGFSDEKVTIVFQWLYYLLSVAFLEEFEFRALFPVILEKEFSRPVQWILPNILYALAHCVPMVVTGMELSQILIHTFNNLGGYVLYGLFLEWCKRKTKCLWGGVLFHALTDFQM